MLHRRGAAPHVPRDPQAQGATPALLGCGGWKPTVRLGVGILPLPLILGAQGGAARQLSAYLGARVRVWGASSPGVGSGTPLAERGSSSTWASSRGGGPGPLGCCSLSPSRWHREAAAGRPPGQHPRLHPPHSGRRRRSRLVLGPLGAGVKSLAGCSFKSSSLKLWILQNGPPGPWDFVWVSAWPGQQAATVSWSPGEGGAGAPAPPGPGTEGTRRRARPPEDLSRGREDTAAQAPRGPESRGPGAWGPRHKSRCGRHPPGPPLHLHWGEGISGRAGKSCLSPGPSGATRPSAVPDRHGRLHGGRSGEEGPAARPAKRGEGECLLGSSVPLATPSAEADGTASTFPHGPPWVGTLGRRAPSGGAVSLSLVSRSG